MTGNGFYMKVFKRKSKSDKIAESVKKLDEESEVILADIDRNLSEIIVNTAKISCMNDCEESDIGSEFDSFEEEFV